MQSPSLRDHQNHYLSSEKLKEIAQLLARKRGIKDYESMPEDRLLNALILSRPLKKDKKTDFSKARIGEIEREFKKLKHKFSKSKRNEIRRNLSEIKNKKNLFTLGTGKIENNLDKLEIFLFKTKKCCDCDDAEYLDMIRPYLVDIINDHKTQSEWKIQLTAAINFISPKPDSNEIRIMRIKSNNIEIMIGSDTNEVIEELFKSLLQRYQKVLEEKMHGSEFVFDGVNALYYGLNELK